LVLFALSLTRQFVFAKGGSTNQQAWEACEGEDGQMDWESVGCRGTMRMSGRRRLKAMAGAIALSAIALCLAASSALALSPSVASKAATNVDYTTATLNGSVNPNGLETKTYFEYGPTISYGTKTAEVGVGSGSSALETAKAVTSLTPNTTYHYRVVATNADGTSTGGDRTFTVGWKVEPLAESGTKLKDVSCASPTMCMAVKDSSVQRWNGSEWTSQTLAVPTGGKSVTAEAVSCSSVSACVVVGSYVNASSEPKTLAETWNGSEWKVQTSPTPASFGSLRSVSCPAASECTAVGATGATQSFAMRWNGSEWSLQTTINPSSDTYLTSVSCVSSTFCMATGYYYDSTAGKWTPHAQRWNGTEWSTQAPVKPAGANISWLYGVSCVSSSACWAVGPKEVDAGTHETQTMVQFWNGSSWSLQTSPNPEASNRNPEDVSCTSSLACMAVGVLSTGSGYRPFSLKWDGTSWTAQDLPLASGSAQAWLSSTSCVSSRGCVAVGQKWNASSVVVPFAEDNWRPASPTVTTTAATSVGEKSATLNGTANPNGSETKVYFEYGTTTSYGTKTAEFNVGSGTSAVEQGAAITGLSPATTYHYRIVGNNENPETSKGGDQTFRTTGPPSVLTSPGEPDGTGEAATLRGWVNPNGLSTTYQFEYGTTSGTYTNTVPIPAESAGSGTETKSVSYKISGLTRGKTYYYRITASNSAGTSNGSEVSFTTPNVPGASTGSVSLSEITRKCATLPGTVEPHGLTTKYWFEYGTTTSYGTKIPVTPKEVSSWISSESVKETPCGLASKTLYHYRLVAENSLGTTNGSDQTFTTFAAVTLSVKGVPLEAKAPLKASGANLKFTSNTGVVHTCQEVEFAGTVTENPGALQSMTTLKMQNAGGAACAYEPFGLTIKYSSPTEGKTLEYTVNKVGEGIVKSGKFVLIGTTFLGATKIGDCEYSAELNGTYPLGKALEWSLSGKLELVKENPKGSFCFASETLTATLPVTSSGSTVETK
jgi:hypothetical protein